MMSRAWTNGPKMNKRFGNNSVIIADWIGHLLSLNSHLSCSVLGGESKCEGENKFVVSINTFSSLISCFKKLKKVKYSLISPMSAHALFSARHKWEIGDSSLILPHRSLILYAHANGIIYPKLPASFPLFIFHQSEALKPEHFEE